MTLVNYCAALGAVSTTLARLGPGAGVRVLHLGAMEGSVVASSFIL